MNTRSGCYVRIATKELDEISKSQTREVCDENLSTSNLIDVYICKTSIKVEILFTSRKGDRYVMIK